MKALMKSDTLHLVFTSSRLQEHRGRTEDFIQKKNITVTGAVDGKVLNSPEAFTSSQKEQSFKQAVVILYKLSETQIKSFSLILTEHFWCVTSPEPWTGPSAGWWRLLGRGT